MSQSLERKLQLLLHKIGYLNLELEEQKEKLESHEKEFNKGYVEDSNVSNEATPGNESSDDSSDTPNDSDVTASEEISDEEKLDDPDVKQPEEFRRIWKSIAVKTHPDKTGNDAELTALYKRASLAYDEKRYEVLIEIASRLSIKIENPSEQLLKILEDRIHTLEKDLKKINDSVLWSWASATPDKKRAIEEALRSYRKYKKKKQSKH